MQHLLKWAILTWKFQKISNRLIFNMDVEMAKKSSFIMVTPINNGQMYLKINFRRYCFSVLWNNFYLDLAIIWRASHGGTSTISHSQHAHQISAHLKNFNFQLKICRFRRQHLLKWTILTWKFQKISNRLLFDMHVGNG